MRRPAVVLALIFVLVVAACGSAADPTTTTSPPSGVAPTTTSAPPDGTQAPEPPAEVTTTTVASGGEALPPAPLDAIPVHGGEPLLLSEEDLPVLVVFWAEWCTICQRELPAIESVAGDYDGRVRFVSVAWKGTEAATAARASELLPSGLVSWGLDDTGEFFAAWGVPYQPETVLLLPDDTIHRRWPGAVGEDELRARLDALLESAGRA